MSVRGYALYSVCPQLSFPYDRHCAYERPGIHYSQNDNACRKLKFMISPIQAFVPTSFSVPGVTHLLIRVSLHGEESVCKPPAVILFSPLLIRIRHTSSSHSSIPDDGIDRQSSRTDTESDDKDASHQRYWTASMYI